MRILIYGINFSPELTGIGKYTGEIARYLAANGHSVRVVTAPPYYPHWQLQEGYSSWRFAREHSRGLDVLRCPLYVPNRPTPLRRILHLTSFALSSSLPVLAQALWRPDVVLCIAPTILCAPVGLLCARATRAKAWLHIQDFEFETAIRLDLLPKTAYLQNWMEGIERAILRRFARVSSITPPMLDRLAQKGVRGDRLELIPNWVDTCKIYPNDSNPEEFGIPVDKFVALYSGNLGVKQGLESLIETAHRLASNSKIHFVICGEGSMRVAIEHLAVDAPNIQFLPLQPEENFNKLLNTADIHLLPELAGASDLVMPSKLGGMLASGRPVVASATKGSQIEKIINEAGLVVAPGDIEGMANAIQLLASDPSLCAELSDKGRKFAVKHLSKAEILKAFASKISEFVA